jgi:hypothetical protein
LAQKEKSMTDQFQPDEQRRSKLEAQQRARELAWEKLQQARQQLNDNLSTDSNAWLHWEYSPKEWALFDQIDWKTRQRTARLPVTIAAGVFLVLELLEGTILIATSDYANIGTYGITSLVFAAIIFFVPLFFYLVYRHRYNEAKKRHEARAKTDQSHRVTFSKKGVWEAGSYFPLNESSTVELLKVKMTLQPPVLHFSRTVTVANMENPLFDIIRVLVPAEHETEAAHLLERFQVEVINEKKQAQKRAEDERLHPPEPN